MQNNNYILEMIGITKKFPGVKALDDVSLNVKEGEIHALMGANGAGKSTLMKILAGVFKQDEGQMRLFGKEVSFKSPSHAQDFGVSIVFQELNVIPHLSVLENIFINRELVKPNGLYNWQLMKKKAKKIMEDLELDIDLNKKVKDLTVAQQQMVEIVKAVSSNAKIIIFDEPTSSLSANEVDILYTIMKKIQKQDVSLIYISHRLEEIFKICERITILRDGQLVDTFDIDKITKEELVSTMIGRDLDEEFPTRKANIGSEILKLEGLSSKGHFEDISFSLHKGEVLGLAGLVGAGRTEVAKAIFGEFTYQEGKIFFEDRYITPKSSRQALNLGIAYCTEDRKNEGLLLGRSIRENISLATLGDITSIGLINKIEELQQVNVLSKSLSIKTPSIEQRVVNLSGGNQQKVSLAKWLLAKPKVIILDEPTRGIDVGAKYEFYNLINELAEQGVGVIVISSEEEELIGLCDKLVVLNEGRVSGEMVPYKDCKEELMKYMLGI